MKRFLLFLVISSIFTLRSIAQVKPEYLYNPSMPYGTLDIRTKISASTYYYLDEGKTFSYRESAPGVRTNTFLDMTSWDSSPFLQGNLRKKDGASDSFVMNYRLLPPVGYNASYTQGYPMIVIMHGAGERANCYYNNCYHGGWTYDANSNVPAAPTNSDHKLLNNDHHLIMGGTEHLAARNLAGSRLPDDPLLPGRAFPGFVLMAQMMNVWDSLNVEDVIRIVQLHCEKYNINKNRIYIHGLSIGGYATYEAIKRAPWLFAAALPMSAVTEAANIFKHNQQEKVAHMPIWIFQGGKDKAPSPDFTNAIIQKFQEAGAVISYKLYPNNGHRVWDKAYDDPNFFKWMLARNKTQLHVASGNTVIDKSLNKFPRLVLAEGFFSYQWEKDGVVMANVSANALIINSPGVYRARFSRVSSTPAETQWEEWSPPVTITQNGEDGDDDTGGDDGSDDDDSSGGDDTGGDDGSDGDDDGNTGGDDGDTGGDNDTGGDDDSGDDDSSGGDDTGGDDGSDDGDDGDDGSTGGDDGDTGGDNAGGGDGSDGDDTDDGGDDDTGGTDDSGDGDNSDGDDDNSDGDTGGDNDSGGDDDNDGGDTGGNDGSDGDDAGNDDNGSGSGDDTDGNDSDPDGDDDSGDDDTDGNDGFDGDTGGNDNDTGGEDPITNVEEGNNLVVSVYPNPASIEALSVEISSKNNSPVSIRLIDLLGHKITELTVDIGTSQGTFKLNKGYRINDGVYILIISNPRYEIRKRIFIRSN